MSKNVQAPLSIGDFVDYHAGNWQHSLRGAVDADQAKMMATASLLATFNTNGEEKAPSYNSRLLQKSLGDQRERAIEKALASDASVIPVAGTTGADALKTNDLINTIQSTALNSERYAPTWKWINKKPTRQDVVQNTEMSDYGNDDGFSFIDETQTDGGLDAFDPALERKANPVKWLGQFGRVMRTALAVEALGLNGDPEIGNAREVSRFARLEALNKGMNRALWFGDNSKNSHEFNGILRQIEVAGTSGRPTEFDMQGRPVTPDDLSAIQTFMWDNGGYFTDMFAGQRVFANLRDQLTPYIRHDGLSGNEPLGLDASKLKLLSVFQTRQSEVDFHLDAVLDPSPKDGTHSGATNAPTAPTSVTVTSTSSSVTNKWGSVLAPSGGTFYYAVSAYNAKGESVVTAGDTAATVTASQKAVLTIARSDSTTVYYNIYRGTSPTRLKLLGRAKCTGASVVYNDTGDTLPGTGNIVFLSNGAVNGGFSEVMFRQLWPIDLIELPQATMAEQYAYICAGSVQLLKPIYNVILRNVGLLDPTGGPQRRVN